jgi:CheY-like chemotaxis protein
MGYTILVVEDTADTRELMKMLLEFEGYSVLEAENGVVAVLLAKREHPDAIVMDMSLPLMDGCQATKCISPRADTGQRADNCLHGPQLLGVAQQGTPGRLHRFFVQACGLEATDEDTRPPPALTEQLQ